MDEETDYQKERKERLRRNQRQRIATLVYRDLIAEDNHSHPGRETPQDFAGMACCAVEAADALLAALDFDPSKQLLPEYIQE